MMIGAMSMKLGLLEVKARGLVGNVSISNITGFQRARTGGEDPKAWDQDPWADIVTPSCDPSEFTSADSSEARTSVV